MIAFKVKLSAIACAAALGLLVSPASAQEDFFNPSADKDDITVLLPCDFKMVFRKIYTSHEHSKIKDASYSAGSGQNPSPFAQNPNERHIQGGFYDKKGYYFLLSKYELMQGQYEALTLKEGQKCPAMSRKLQLPAVNISYYDAQNAALNMSEFLQKNDQDFGLADKSLSKNVYARMPTDSEWEFAARGGIEVSEVEFDGNLPPLPDGEKTLADYAWFQGPQSANGKLQLPARLAPNPLKLYDMLGNVQEMVFDLFKATRTGRLHGQNGGLTVRGGSFMTPASQMSSASRTEKALISGGKPVKAKDMGTRFALSMPVANSASEVRELNEEIEKLGTGDSGKADSRSQNTVQMLDEMIKKQEQDNKELISRRDDLEKLNATLEKNNKALTESMGKLREEIVNANSERDDMRDAAVLANLKLGGFLCQSLNDEESTHDFLKDTAKRMRDRCQENKNLCRQADNYDNSVKNSELKLDVLATYYGDTIASALKTYNLSLFKNSLKTSMQSHSNSRYAGFIEVYYKHMQEYAKLSRDTDKNKQHWIQQCHEYAVSRTKK